MHPRAQPVNPQNLLLVGLGVRLRHPPWKTGIWDAENKISIKGLSPCDSASILLPSQPLPRGWVHPRFIPRPITLHRSSESTCSRMHWIKIFCAINPTANGEKMQAGDQMLIKYVLPACSLDEYVNDWVVLVSQLARAGTPRLVHSSLAEQAF